jgi:hypothetical protein
LAHRSLHSFIFMGHDMKHYFVFGYTDGQLASMSTDGFSELSLALEFLATIDKNHAPFVAVRLINI